MLGTRTLLLAHRSSIRYKNLVTSSEVSVSGTRTMLLAQMSMC